MPLETPGIGSAAGLGARSGMGTAHKGDWTCTVCKVNVFARKIACFRCGSPKATSATNMAEDEGKAATAHKTTQNAKSAKKNKFATTEGEGHTKLQDWTCGNCGADVCGSKTACFRCGGPKSEVGLRQNIDIYEIAN